MFNLPNECHSMGAKSGTTSLFLLNNEKKKHFIYYLKVVMYGLSRDNLEITFTVCASSDSWKCTVIQITKECIVKQSIVEVPERYQWSGEFLVKCYNLLHHQPTVLLRKPWQL